MKKTAFFALFLLIAGAVMGQEYTFQGLPWGSSIEQVIEKLGQPEQINDMLVYSVSVSGYKALLNIEFDHTGMNMVVYDIGRVFYNRDFNQAEVIFAALFMQLEHKYGAYHEIITDFSYWNNESFDFFVWHFNNFHISIVMGGDGVEIAYCSDSSWNVLIERLKGDKKDFIHLPNTGL
jgi:hypothetical protein